MRPSAPQERKRFRWNGEHEMEGTGPTGERGGERRREKGKKQVNKFCFENLH
jgi:hypothetical protein|tara:strand:+ start:534 stop:689 length:156 start_codon:yes stop_codon:yes gene_type:complete